MRKFTLILISLFILVVGISCASAVDLNSHSFDEKNVVRANFVDGNLGAPITCVDDSDSVVLNSQSISSDYVSSRPYDSDGAPLLQWLSGSRRHPLGVTPEPPVGVTPEPPVGVSLESGLGGGGEQNYY